MTGWEHTALVVAVVLLGARVGRWLARAWLTFPVPAPTPDARDQTRQRTLDVPEHPNCRCVDVPLEPGYYAPEPGEAWKGEPLMLVVSLQGGPCNGGQARMTEAQFQTGEVRLTVGLGPDGQVMEALYRRTYTGAAAPWTWAGERTARIVEEAQG